MPNLEEAIPKPTYRVLYRGEMIFVESRMRDALARIPRDSWGWKITYTLGDDPERRVAFVGGPNDR